MSLHLGLNEDVIVPDDQPKIIAVRAYVTRAGDIGADGGASDVHDTAHTHWIQGQPPHHPPITNPMSCYPKYSEARSSWGVANVPSVLVEIEQEDGLIGVGMSTGGEAACFIIEHHLAMFVEGQNVRNISYMWEQMWRASIHYGRKGLGVHAISAVDIALWDLLGKVKGEPVYNLMGGKTKERVPCYATTSRPDLAKEMGFFGAKVPLIWGPHAGDVGMRKNVEALTEWREKVGPDFPLMVDCYMALDVQYAAALCKRLDDAGLNIKWLEECVMPDDYVAHKKLADRMAGQGTGTFLATGEHEYSRWGFQQLIDAGVGLLQPDVMWCGGPTSFMKIVALASASGVPVVPHGCGVYGYFMAMAFNECPLAEFMIMSENADSIDPNFGNVFTNEPLPVDGYITLPHDKPGWGLELNRDALGLVRPHPHDPEDPKHKAPPAKGKGFGLNRKWAAPKL